MEVKGKTRKFISIAEMKKHLKFCSKYRIFIEEERHFDKYKYANIIYKKTQVELTYRKGSKTVTYISKIDGKAPKEVIRGWEAYQQINKYYKVPDLRGKYGYNVDYNGKVGWNIPAARAILYFNKEYNNSRIDNCYGYDLNSAYNYAMLKQMPDTSVAPKMGKIGKGEIGFTIGGQVLFSGTATYVFPLMDSPFKDFVKHWYNIKKNSSGVEKARAKNMLVYAIGYFQRVNVFLRSTIIYYANEFIKNLMDENTLFVNTDSIVSKVKRPDIEEHLGEEVGEWKIEHLGKFAYKEFSYQWNNDLPSIRGVSQGWLENWNKYNKRPFDVLTDEIPYIECNDYELVITGPNKYELREVNYEEVKSKESTK